jgi:hypothetical protein
MGWRICTIYRNKLFLRHGAKNCKGTVFNKYCIQHILMLHISKFFEHSDCPFSSISENYYCNVQLVYISILVGCGKRAA